MTHNRLRTAAPFLLALLAALQGCQKPPTSGTSRDLDTILAKKRMVIVTRNSPTTWYQNREDQPAGLEHDLARAFAEHLGVEAEFLLVDSTDEVLRALRDRKADFAAAGLSPTPERSKTFLFGPSYQAVAINVVCHTEVPVRKPADLVGVKVSVIKGSSYLEELAKLRDTDLPDLRWEVTDEYSTELLLQQVWERTLDCTVADSNVFAVHRRYYPELRTVFPLAVDQTLAWALNTDQLALQEAMRLWLPKYEELGHLKALLDQYYGFTEHFDYVDTRIFMRRVEEILPKYRALFEKAGEEYGFPWKLLAAVAYQESHWEPHAKSRTGVRGMMMLTQNTAEAMGVTDRLDPEQSIQAGARYLRKMINRIPAYVPEPSRTWMGVASYNVGYSHLRDARSLAVLLEKDPNRWADVKEVLPLLAQQKYYSRLWFGYARGMEPVIYVSRIRSYYDMLRNFSNEGGESRESDALLLLVDK
jgi:membrane-bound lytic murein transglycosylase F